MSPRRSALRTRLTSIGYGVFYRLPPKVRTRLVRIATPTYTVGAVVLLFSSTEPRRLLLLRQPPGRGWSLPAGLLERGETPAQGAVREAAEETGIEIDPADLLPANPNAVVHTKGRWVDTVFTADLDPDRVELSVDGAEVWEAAWHPLDDLPKMTVATGRLLGVYGIGPYAADEPTGGLPGSRPAPRKDQ
ncbi:NUDIX hydrolase [Hamadaea tsunoensis]|uniref:NUDIX hydrolase n=1 Tax=Hamadaea tsunoensis TaxID=53368 RepID=UPI0004221200|nr:NUDIX hydrolase [Hamadaea tsunoensis]